MVSDDLEAPSWFERHPRTARSAAIATAAAGAIVVARAWTPSFPLPEATGVAVLGGLSLVTVALLLWREAIPTTTMPRRRAGWPLLLAAALAVLAWTNLGRFHGLTFVHHWEQFHHVLGAKYFPELGWDGLYAASLAAEATAHPDRGVQPWVRDLRDDEVIPVDSPRFEDQVQGVAARFTAARREAFGRDQAVFLDHNNSNYLEAIRRDHGLNATPTWVAIARPIASAVTLDLDGLRLLGALDLGLLAAALIALWRSFGARVGALGVVLVGTSYLGRFWWIGGAFLREDWLFLVVLGVCLLHRERPGAAGAAFAGAAAMRVFPVLLLLGPAISYAANRRWPELRRLVVGAAVAGLLALGLGGLAGRGFGAWFEYATEIERHSRTWLTNNVGLANVVLYGPVDFRREVVDFSLPEPWIHWQARLDARAADRAPLIWSLRLGLLGLLAAACRRVRPAEAAALGIFAVFALTYSTCYYWQMLALLAVVRTPIARWGAIAVNLAMFAIHFSSPSFEWRYGFFSWALLALALAILLPLALRPEPVAKLSPRPAPPSPPRKRG